MELGQSSVDHGESLNSTNKLTLAEKLKNHIKEIFCFEQRQATFQGEIYAGFIHYISCVFILPVVSHQLGKAGYSTYFCCVMTASMMSLGSIIAGIFSNLPFVISPAASIFIYLSFALRQKGMGELEGNQAVAISGFCMLALFFRPFLRFLVKLIPQCIQVSTAIGVGLITALAGCLNVNLIVEGTYSISALGKITADTRIAMGGFLLVGILRHFKVKGSFLVVLIINSVAAWAQDNSWQSAVGAVPHAPLQRPFNHHISSNTLVLAGELFFLYLLLLNSMCKGFCELAGLMNTKKQVVPRVRWIYLVCGACTALCGFFGGPPIVISPECGAGILAGAKTGFSSVVAGILFGFTVFFSPLLQTLPGAAIAPLLVSLGAVSMVNAKKIEFSDYRVAWPAFIVLFLIPFAFDIIAGVVFGWLIYLIIHLVSGDLYKSAKQIVGFYSEALQLNIFVNWLDKYVPAYWLETAPPPASPVAAAALQAAVGRGTIVQVRPSSASIRKSVVPRRSAANANAPRRSTATGPRPSSLVKRNDGSYVVDWASIRQSLYQEFFTDGGGSNDNADGGAFGVDSKLTQENLRPRNTRSSMNPIQETAVAAGQISEDEEERDTVDGVDNSVTMMNTSQNSQWFDINQYGEVYTVNNAGGEASINNLGSEATFC